jgi:hypothetical protein
MERELWRRIVGTLKRLPPTRPRNAVYTDRQVLAVYLWAVLHDRPVSWACQRHHWPVQAWRRSLPDQSTMSRRLRRPGMDELLRSLLDCVQRTLVRGEVLVVDGKPLELSEHTRDPDARNGRGAGRYAKGYKIHLILDVRSRAVVAYETHPLNVAETTTAASLVHRADTSIPRGSLLLGDRLFDSNVLHEATHARGCQLIAPRKRPGTGLGSRRHHPNRIESMRFTEGVDQGIWETALRPQRAQIERFFGTLASSTGGLITLPAWVRRLHRVRLWVAAKLIVNASRIAIRRSVAA